MKNLQFEQLIIDALELSKNHFVEETFLGIRTRKRSLYGRVYIANSSPSFFDIKEDIKNFLDAYQISPDMVHLSSRVNNEEEDVYEWEYVSHNVEGNVLTVQMKNKTVSFCL